MSRVAPLLIALVACNGGKAEDPERLMDTGWFEDTASLDPADCEARYVEVLPEDGDSDWYWRSPPQLLAATEKPEAYKARILDSDGLPAKTTLTWAANRGTLGLDAPLKPDADYHLELTDCTGVRSVPFHTGPYGAPLEGGIDALQGTTWSIDLVGADWVEPGAMSALLAIYFNVPVLIGVNWADETRLDLIGSLGEVNDLGQLEQDTWYESWDFPLTDFTSAPYFDAQADMVTFQYGDVPIPVYNFRFAATVSADGQTLGGGEVSGLGDTRGMGVLLGQEDKPDAVCLVAMGVGVTCQDCPDGEPYCLFLSAREVGGERVDGLTLTEL